MTKVKNFGNGLETDIKSIQSDFKLETSETEKSNRNININNSVDILKVPKEQRDKLESYIKHWINPSKWYESRKNGLEWFLMVAKKNNVKPENVEYVIEENSNKQTICKPIVKNRKLLKEKNLPKLDDINRLRKFLKQYPTYNNRVENGENAADIAISIIKKYSEEEEKRNLGLGN